METKLQKAKKFLKESIINKKTNSLNDTNVYIDKLKYDVNSYSINNDFEHINKFDVNELISFFIDHQVPVFNLDLINKEIDKVIPKLISKGKLTNKAHYYLKDLKIQLNFSKLYIPSEEEIELSERFGWMSDDFGKLKDNRTDLLIYIVSKRNKIKIIITTNYENFINCEEIFKEKIDPNDQEELLILTPQEMVTVIDELKKELGEIK